MRWQTKAKLLRLLSLVPGGKLCYLTGQRISGTTKVHPRRDLLRASELIQLIRECGQSVRGATCYEVGTGWHPFTPLALYLAGATRVITVDINPWLSFASAKQAVQSADPHLEWFAELCSLDTDEVRGRYLRVNRDAGSLEAFLASFSCEYRYPGDACQSGEPDQSIDFVVSSNVLEHVPPEIMERIMRESLRILKPGGLAVHRFNPGDHYANVDESITTANFLRFSEAEWRQYGDGLAYHNRLRSPQYRKIFAEAGFVSLIEKKRVDREALQELQHGRLQPHPDFGPYELKELATDYVWYVGMNPAAVPPQAIPDRPIEVEILYPADS